MAEALGEDVDRLCKLPAGHRRVLVHKALLACERSPETFGDEIAALSDIDEAIHNSCPTETSRLFSRKAKRRDSRHPKPTSTS